MVLLGAVVPPPRKHIKDTDKKPLPSANLRGSLTAPVDGYESGSQIHEL